jgi:hypothetical protein
VSRCDQIQYDMLLMFSLPLRVCDLETPAFSCCAIMPASSKRSRADSPPEEPGPPLLDIERPSETEPLRFCPCCGFPLTQEAREIESQPLALPVAPPADREGVEPKDEEAPEEPESEVVEGSESGDELQENIKTESPYELTMTTDEYGNDSSMLEAPPPSEETIPPLVPKQPSGPPPAHIRHQLQTPSSSSSLELRPFPCLPPPPPPPPPKADPVVGQALKPIGWSGAWPEKKKKKTLTRIRPPDLGHAPHTLSSLTCTDVSM